MPDNLNIRRPLDPLKINTGESWEIKTWTEKFGVTEKQLKDAVTAVGPMVADVKRHLGK